MTEAAELNAIVEQYEKHGWKLRRLLLTRDLAESIGDPNAVFADAEVRTADKSALWFSRRSQPGREAWELRRISASPFAVIEIVPDGLTDDERDELLSAAENRMFETVRPTETSH